MKSWRIVDSMGRGWTRNLYRQGAAESTFADWQFREGTLEEEYLAEACVLARQHDSRFVLRRLFRLAGRWRLVQGDESEAVSCFGKAVQMARERGIQDAESETGLVLSKLRLGWLSLGETKDEAQRLAHFRQPAYRYLGMLWQELGDDERAKSHALAAYRWAWADGEPYVNRYELDRSTELLEELNVSIPDLPPFDSSKVEPFPWEADVRAAIEEIRAEREARRER